MTPASWLLVGQLFVFPNLITVATRREQVSSFLKRSSIFAIAQHFGPHLIILPDAIVLSDPGNLGKHSAKRRAHKLFLASHMFHQRCDFLCPSNGLACHTWKCSCRADNGYHGSPPSKQTDRRLSLRLQLLEHRLRLLQIARVEPLREPPVN